MMFCIEATGTSNTHVAVLQYSDVDSVRLMREA